MLYLIPRTASNFADEAALSEYARKNQIDTDAMIIVKGVPLRMEPQLKLLPLDAAPKSKAPVDHAALDAKVLAQLASMTVTQSTGHIAGAIGEPNAAVSQSLARLVKAGKATKPKRDTYAAVGSAA